MTAFAWVSSVNSSPFGEVTALLCGPSVEVVVVAVGEGPSLGHFLLQLPSAQESRDPLQA